MQNRSEVGEERLTASAVRRQAESFQKLLRGNGASHVEAANADTIQLVPDLLLERSAAGRI